MILRILSDAEDDLLAGHDFYEELCPGLGLDFLRHLDSEILRLKDTFQMHPVARSGYHRAVVRKRFPYAIYYRFDHAHIFIHMVFDCRQDPDKIARRLR